MSNFYGDTDEACDGQSAGRMEQPTDGHVFTELVEALRRGLGL
jgi:hypothetical protein